MVSNDVDSQQRSPQKGDLEIHQDVRAELSIHQDGTRRSVEISVRNSVVSLTGVVGSYAERWAIDRTVRRILGVKDVRNYLHVRPPAVARNNRSR